MSFLLFFLRFKKIPLMLFTSPGHTEADLSVKSSEWVVRERGGGGEGGGREGMSMGRTGRVLLSGLESTLTIIWNQNVCRETDLSVCMGSLCRCIVPSGRLRERHISQNCDIDGTTTTN